MSHFISFHFILSHSLNLTKSYSTDARLNPAFRIRNL